MAPHVLLLDLTVPPDRRLGSQLAQCGFVVRAARDPAGLALFSGRSSPRLAVIRIGNAAGADLNRTLRLLADIPAVVVCARRDEDLIVRCLEAGAETVLVAPLSRRELAARLGALLSGRNGSLPGELRSGSRRYRVGDLVIDSDAHAVRRAGREIALTPTEFRLLFALARRAGQAVRHEELLCEVWGPGRVTTPENLRLYVRYLRQKLCDDVEQPRLLISQRGFGYRLAEGAASLNGRGRRGP